jgi:hypothetical protein
MSLIIGKPLSASELIEKNRNRTLYANYLMQKTAVQYGLQRWVKTEGGSGGTNSESSTYYTDLGALVVSLSEQALFISNVTFQLDGDGDGDIDPDIDFYMPTSGTDILSFLRAIVIPNTDSNLSPRTGGSLTINGYSFGSFDYTIANTTNVGTFTSSDWFTSNADNSSALVVVNGNLTIAAGQTFAPSVRKLFTVIYVMGNLTVNGAISMSALGANSTTVTSNTISIASGTYSIVGGGTLSNPAVPGTGGAGAASRTTAGQTSGTSGSAGGTGGGGGGSFAAAASGTVGTGSTGTAFSGGSGSGALIGTGSTSNAGANGGAGSDGFSAGVSAPGGAGNPGGSAVPANASFNGGNGTGGTLIIICEGTLSGSGTISANGVAGGTNSTNIGGGSGGGSVTIFSRSDSSSISPTANGGGNGGAGTARKLLL